MKCESDRERDDLQRIIDKALKEMELEAGGTLDLEKANLAEFQRKTGLTRSKCRTIRDHGFKALPHGRTGQKAAVTKLTGYESQLDDLLRGGVTNSEVCYDRLVEKGYSGGRTTVKDYIHDHKCLVPAKRKLAVEPQGSRGRRFKTAPGEAFQMDWGFVNVVDLVGAVVQIACFAMVCHHCGSFFVEFFPNARQESLFIGMLHAFGTLGVPGHVLTDNMKSVVTCRDFEGKPVWNPEYAAFMKCVGFETRLCKPRHPFTKGKVERLVQYVKRNLLAGMTFTDITDLNGKALAWCDRQGGRYRRAVACVPKQVHSASCLPACHEPAGDCDVCLCPRRTISFDGFVSYEGRRFGVPYWYAEKTCRVSRVDGYLHIYSDDLSRELVAHPVTWSRKDAFCEDQYADMQPEEHPTARVATTIRQVAPAEGNPALAKFSFGEAL